MYSIIKNTDRNKNELDCPEIATRTNAYHYRIIKDETNPLCRISGKYEETIDHIVSG